MEFRVIGLIAGLFMMSFPCNGEMTMEALTIDSVIDLKGETWYIPSKTVLDFKGGCISNGKIVGNQTKIIGSTEKIFSEVTVAGSWKVPEISTDMFVSLDYVNSLRDVLALASPDINNIITVKEGNYILQVVKNNESALVVPSHTDLRIDGIISLVPNSFANYAIIMVEGTDISISGKGSIIGERDLHYGEKGEWGMGINIVGAKNVLVKDLSVKNCWGDCIYIGKNSDSITISNCYLEGSRRQGISVTSGKNIVISGGSITKIGGALPEYAIDVEPNKNGIVQNVLIDGVTIKDCRGGIMTYGGADKAHIGSVFIKNCCISGIKFRAPFSFISTDRVEVTNCNISIDIIKFVFRFQNVEKGVIKDNIVSVKRFFAEPCSNIEITGNTIICGGFFTDDVNLKQHANILIRDNKFESRVPKLPPMSRNRRIVVLNNKKLEK